MSDSSPIEWTDATANFWHGCTKKSPACLHCYAETWDSRKLYDTVTHFGKGIPRLDMRANAVAVCQRLDRKARRTGWRPRVFVNAMSDWLDDEVPVAWLATLLATIAECHHLTFQLLTKRPEHFRTRLEAVASAFPGESRRLARRWLAGKPPRNVWLGTTVEDQTRANERIPILLATPAVVRFLSCEPFLGPVNLRSIDLGEAFMDALDGSIGVDGRGWTGPMPERIHWVIAGGESGRGSRPPSPDWFRDLRDQCATAGVPFFFKQWGEWGPGVRKREKDNHRLATGEILGRFGKKITGRKLDGRTHDEFPTPQPADVCPN